MESAAQQDTNIVELRKNGPAEDALVALNLGKMQRAKSEFETANGNYRNTLKHVEAKGIHLSAAKDAISIKKSGKVDEKVGYLKALFEYLMILGIGVDKKQLDMFRVEGAARDGDAKARELGRYCGIMGHGTDQNPYALDSDLGQSWMSSFHEGLKERELILSMEPGGTELIEGGDDDVFNEDED